MKSRNRVLIFPHLRNRPNVFCSTMCDLEGCTKKSYPQYRCTNGKTYCTKKHLNDDHATQTEEAKAAWKLAYAKSNAIGNAKTSAETMEKAVAENARLRNLGIRIDPTLTPRIVDEIALSLVKRIERIVPADHMFYVWTSGIARIIKETWACTSTRSTPLVTLPDRQPVGKTLLTKTYKWQSIVSLYTSNNDCNVNMAEKRVHQLMYADKRSMWIDCGKGGVHQDEGGLLSFQLAIIHGPREGLRFAAQHPRTHPLMLTPSLRIRLNDMPEESSHEESESKEDDDDDDYDTKPSAIVQVTKSRRPFILEDDDVDDDTKPSAMKLVTEPHALRPPPLNDRSLDNFNMPPSKHQRTLEVGQSTAPGSKPTKAKAQQGLWGRTAGRPPPKKPKPSATFGLSSKLKKK